MEESRILEIHDSLFTYLSKRHEKDNSFRFTLRKSDLGLKLTKGYWFYGGKNYVAVSFWNGFDNLTKMPNISFKINTDYSCELFFSSRDSDKKQEYLLNYIYKTFDSLSITDKNQAYIKLSSDDNYINCLEEFLITTKKKIDKIIEFTSKSYFENASDKIDFLDGREFNLLYNRNIKRQQNYLNIIKPVNVLETSAVSLKSLRIINFGPIKEIDIPNFGMNKQWIFLTGENGGGKSAIFKAITSCLANDHKYLTKGDYSNYEVEIKLTSEQKEYKRKFISTKFIDAKLSPLYKGFAAYGASRLRINKNIGSDLYYMNNITICDSIFSYNSELLDFWSGISLLQLDSKSSIATTRIQNVREVLFTLIDNLKEIYLPGEFDEMQVYYRENESGDNPRMFDPVPYDYLASGIRSIIAMVGDMMLRLFDQQKSVISPSELTGIVIIDEIDVHLHPIYQKKFVEKLTIIFPIIQFIVSTHSPIPLLGAPKNSIIYIVKREYEKGVFLERVDDKLKLNNLNPNLILTSPIFGFNNIFPNSLDRDKKRILTKDHYEDVVFQKIVQDKINLFLESDD